VIKKLGVLLVVTSVVLTASVCVKQSALNQSEAGSSLQDSNGIEEEVFTYLLEVFLKSRNISAIFPSNV